ncbi:haloacid dehalogenase-like hydrolase domain-containing protein At2g33255 [Fagus crenata]
MPLSFLSNSKSFLFFLLHSKFPFPMATLTTTTATATPTRARLKGVVFDMDGTLTVPVIDFAAMYKAVLGDDEYRRIKAENPSGIDILHHIENWSPEKQQKAYETIADYERRGLDRLQIMPGAAELCGFLDAKKIRRGLITRNVKEAVDLFHQRFGLTFGPALSREFRPYKPDPGPLLHICSAWEVLPNEVMMIGDSLKDDVACGKRAGAFTCLLDEIGRYDSPDYANVDLKPDFKVSSLTEVYSLLEEHFDLAP